MYHASDYAEFTESLHSRRATVAEDAVDALAALGATLGAGERPALERTSKLLEDAVTALVDAEDELRCQNDALFAASTELEESAAVYRELFDSAPAAFFVTTCDARVTHANRAACQLLRRPLNALVGKPLACFVALDERGAFRAALARSRDSLLIEEWPIRLTPAGTHAVECRVRTSATRARSGATVGLSWIIVDTSSDVFGAL
jgi:PAS domain S-box-containing protein